MKIISLVAENVKKLRAVSITPDGAIVQITGANGSGKSSVLDAIYYALAGTKGHASQPIRKGQQRAMITLDLGTVVVVRRFTEAGGTSLTVENADGSVFRSPQTMLDALLSSLSFDPLEFSRMAPRAQLETLRRLVTLDIDIDAVDREIGEAFEQRTAVNRRVKSLTERVSTLAAGIDPAMETELTDVSALLSEMEGASAHNTDLERRRARRAALVEEIAEDRTIAADKRDRAADLLAAAEQLEVKANENERKLASAEPLPDPVDVSGLAERIRVAQRENKVREAQERQRALHQSAVDELTAASAERDNLTQTIEDQKAAKQTAIAAAAFPVDGLSFGDGEVTYNGVPFAQASSAEQLRVSVALAMAANPKLRILRITDGSLLDEASLAMIAAMAEAADYQCWIERVDTSGKIGVFMTDGAVVAVNGEPVMAPVGDEVAAD